MLDFWKVTRHGEYLFHGYTTIDGQLTAGGGVGDVFTGKPTANRRVANTHVAGQLTWETSATFHQVFEECD